ncbi:PucR family transcriptional regulator [Lysinibacter cavernae]|uniref:PucR C-terminal helix-turn-helix domain-containing protein n=1 Tax=Lysinibacter cavernae TaxID=1640652 RepID=A0A7X5TUS0_9MICO|nr:PucR family transcriptional regulator [Lysinibacter cavernae]NIH54864.1 hypothetical protein [Lysinibacter cavernae]
MPQHVHERGRSDGSTTLRGLLNTVGQPLVELVTGQARLDDPVRSVALVEADELRSNSIPQTDALVLVGVRGQQLAELLPLVRDNTVVFAKLGAEDETPAVGLDDAVRLADGRGVTVVRVHHEASWDQLMGILQRLLIPGAPHPSSAAAQFSGDDIGDLFALAETVATQVRGLVTIEEIGGEVLAYSQATEGADELRISSILGRRGPADQMRRLSDEGVLRALAEEGGMLRVPANPELGRAARLAAGIHSEGAHIGNIWVQRGSTDFSGDADTLLPGAARLAARLLQGRRHAVQREDALVLGALGLGSGDASVAETYALASLLNPQANDLIAVVGFVPLGVDGRDPASPSDVMSYLRLHAASYRRPIVLAAKGNRLYGVAATPTIGNLERWAANALSGAAGRFGPGLRAAVAEANDGVEGVTDARRAIDHLMDAVRRDPARYPSVVSLSGLRSDVLLREIVALVETQPKLRDPRLERLRQHDAASDGDLVASIRAYLDHFADVRGAAETLRVHPNTLRYRIGRAESISGLDLGDPATRAVLNILLRIG